MSPGDIDRLGDGYIEKIFWGNARGVLLGVRDRTWSIISTSEKFQELSAKLLANKSIDGSPIKLKRDYLREYFRLQALGEKGGLPKVLYNKYSKGKAGFTEDVLEEGLLRKYVSSD